jgi:hypothetical protein
MSELFRTNYGKEWFRQEGTSLDSEGKRKLYYKIRDWESVAISGVKGWAHSMSSAARASSYPFEYHMRKLLIEVKGIHYVQSIESRNFEQRQKQEAESRKAKAEHDKYLSDLDRRLRDALG